MRESRTRFRVCDPGLGGANWGIGEIVDEGYRQIFQILFFQKILIKNIRMLISLDERNQRVQLVP